MNPKECPEALKISGSEITPEGYDARLVECRVINNMVGMRCAWGIGACATCQYAKGDDSLCRELAKRHLTNLIANGNQPHFANHKDLLALAKTYATMATDGERVALLTKAADRLSATAMLGAENVLAQLEEIEAGLGTMALEAVL